MPAPSPGHDGTLSVADRKQQLALLCAADRVAWTKACRSERRPVVTGLRKIVLGGASLLGAFLPGRIGRWYRQANFVAGLFRNFTGAAR